MRIGFIGTGEIASAMVQGLAGQGHQIMVSERNPQTAQHLQATYPEVAIGTNAQVIAGADVVFLCLMADVARIVLPDLTFEPGQSVVSVMVDVPLTDLQMLCAPATDIAITIPLSAVAIGGSMLPVYPGSAALTELFGSTDTVFSVASEMALNAHFAGSALSAPLIDLMRSGSRWLAQQTGDEGAAEAYVAGVFEAFLRQMRSGEADFDTLLQGLATAGGLNAHMKAKMQEAAAHEALIEGLESLKPRLGI